MQQSPCSNLKVPLYGKGRNSRFAKYREDCLGKKATIRCQCLNLQRMVYVLLHLLMLALDPRPVIRYFGLLPPTLYYYRYILARKQDYRLSPSQYGVAVLSVYGSKLDAPSKKG